MLSYLREILTPISVNFLPKSINYTMTFPLRTKYISEKRLQNPWITTAVIKSIKTINNLYKDYKVGAITENHYKV